MLKIANKEEHKIKSINEKKNNTYFTVKITNSFSIYSKKMIKTSQHSFIINNLSTVGQNIIATIKMRNNFRYPLKMVAILDFSLLLPI